MALAHRAPPAPPAKKPPRLATFGALLTAVLLVASVLVETSLHTVFWPPVYAPVASGTTTSTTPPPAELAICSNPSGILNSPFSYNGTATTFTSGEYGLPTFGSAGTDYPSDTAGVIEQPGTVTGSTLDTAGTIYYFVPGTFTMSGAGQPGDNAVFLGGYLSGTFAVISGNAPTNNVQFLEGSGAPVTIEYLTVKNFTSSQNSSFINSWQAAGWTVEYNTIGPNEFGYPSGSGQGSGGGYAIDMGSDDTVEYNCLTQNAQGAFNAAGGPGVLLTGDLVSNNEISWNGLGEYPDSGGGSNTYANCGCSGGGKFFWTTNFVITNNYVHDNYNAGIWGDFNNAGADISDNDIASNWGVALDYEASYNANISNNTFTGNGWASDGAWPSAPDLCYGGIACTNGLGPVTGAGGGFPYGAIYLPNSGGNSLISSNYSGQLLVEDNTFTNNFGGIAVYTDPSRYSGGAPNWGQCDSPLQGTNVTYYQTSQQIASATGTLTSGQTTASTSAAITEYFNAFCGYPGAATAPTAGEHVYDSAGGIPANDTVASSPAPTTTSFSLTTAATATESSDTFWFSPSGGCGLYDLYGTTGPGNSGAPLEDYWDNCIWSSNHITVSGNVFSMASGSVTGCTSGALCGVMAAISFLPGIPTQWQFYQPYFVNNIAVSTSHLANVWSSNAYSWTGTGGSSAWQFEAGSQGSAGDVSHATWTGVTYGQDAGSTGL